VAENRSTEVAGDRTGSQRVPLRRRVLSAAVEASELRDSGLDLLAAEIRQHHKAVERHARSMLGEAIAAGEALIEAKGRLRHGEFGPFIAYCGTSRRSASLYMKLAREKGNVAVLEASSIRVALEALGGTRKRREPPRDFGKPGASLADDEYWQDAAYKAALRTGRWDALAYRPDFWREITEEDGAP
jgi:hypothetical protein